MIRATLLIAAGIALVVSQSACERAGSATPAVATSRDHSRSSHELGRAVYNFRCYYCHGYSGDARTLAATYLNPPPRNFTATPASSLSREHMIEAITHGHAGTAMKGFGDTLTGNEIAAVAGFIVEEFMHAKAMNTKYHTEANGWPDHERYQIAFPFALGEIPLDVSIETLSEHQQRGLQLFMGTCISCHDRARVRSEGVAWSIRPTTYPPDFYLLAESGRTAENPQFDPHHAHEKSPHLGKLNKLERRGEKIYQQNCAYCHAQDGTGRNWIGSFLEPNATDLTSASARAKSRAKVVAIIANGMEGTSMPAWKHALTVAEIDAVAAYIHRAFSNPSNPNPPHR